MSASRPRPIASARRLLSGLTGYAAVVVVLTAVATIGADIGRPEVHPPLPAGPQWLDAWFRYDSGWQVGIAMNGYFYIPGQQSAVAFFPAFPMAIRALTLVVGDPQIAGQALAWTFGFGALLAFAVWARRRLPARTALLALALLAVYPYAYYLFGTVYADGMFLLCAIGAFLLLEKRHFVLAGLVGALATAGRPVGLAVLVGLVVRMLEIEAEARRAAREEAAAQAALRPVDPASAPVVTSAESAAASDQAEVGGPAPNRLVAVGRGLVTRLVGGSGVVPPSDLLRVLPRLRPRHAGVLLAFAGLGGWCAYLWWEFGDPLAWIAVQSAPGWAQPAGPRTWFKIAFVGAIVKWIEPSVYLVVPQGLFAGITILLLVPVLRRFGWGYAAYTLVVIGIPILGTKDFMGCGRYMMLAFPAVAAAACLLAEWAVGRRYLIPSVLAVLAAGLLTATFFYGWGFEVS